MVLGHVYVKYQTSGLYRTAVIAKNVRFCSQREHIPMNELNFVTPFDIQIAPLFHYKGIQRTHTVDPTKFYDPRTKYLRNIHI